MESRKTHYELILEHSYRKPTQVDGLRILRCTREPLFRNSAKKLGVTSGYASPAPFPSQIFSKEKFATGKVLDTANVYFVTVYQKHRSLQNRKVTYRG